MTRRELFALAAASALDAATKPTLDPDQFRHHVEFFNAMVPERTRTDDPTSTIPNTEAWPWMKQNIPFFTCPDPTTERLYYYRWWTFRKAISKTPAGYIVLEFLKPVKHAGEYNALSCAFGHHVAEGRWLPDPTYIDQDIHYWLHGGENGAYAKNFHQFSGWAGPTLLDHFYVHGDLAKITANLGALLLDYQGWERERLTPSGLFWQRDVSDGMEESGSGGRKVKNIRPSINSYMFGNAQAIALIADLAHKPDIAAEYTAKAARLRQLTQQKLWNPEAQFFETLGEDGKFIPVRENIGFTPWCFNLPDPGQGYEAAWQQLIDSKGFQAPFGPTTVERRSPLYKLDYEGDDCKWNGPAWPFATTITLRALANVLNDYKQSAITVADYFRTMATYTNSQHLELDNGQVIPWVDENQNPETGEWIARAMKIRKNTFYGRGDHYNHSAYCDLVITGLVGLRPAGSNNVDVNPLVPADAWPWFCLDRVPYHGRLLTIVWDKDGNRFRGRKGLSILADGNLFANRPNLGRLTAPLPG